MMSMWKESKGRGGRRALACRALLALCILLGLWSAACTDGGQSTKDFDADAGANIKRGLKPEADAEVAVLETDFGQIVIELYPNLAPKMVERFKKLASEGFYNGTAFHRINPTLGVVQGGDPNSKDDDPSNDGMGASPYPDVPAEFTDVPFERGMVGAARSASPDSANSQFYITLRRVPQWDEQYTVFGRVIKGMGNADIIGHAPVSPRSERPDPKIILKSVTLQPHG